ncbi:hypothetical protein K2173_016282 [Erythroxylum novogranatense]|uniref:AUGMIN subunit 8 n=1 Tax=Erythroxylum novogranatense TaxID=1862640 RepID=A0AAV8SFS8_9ROSI|nr:hypothetical protein K2173_016282 [Erythroxylum novogranatense]
MDVCESQKHTAVDTLRLPLVPAERNANAAASTRCPRTREVSSRYKSPTPSAPVSRRCSSPTLTRTLQSASQVVSKRALSAERSRPATPTSPKSPSTPVHDSSVDAQLTSRRLSTGSRLPESLWPSTMRSLSVSFQSDTISIPVGKKEKPVSNISSNRTLRSSSNVVHKQVETPTGSRKPTPERKRTPPKGKSAQDQSENAKPGDGLHNRLIDQHRWPSRIGGKVSSNSLNRSVDLNDKNVRPLSTPAGSGLSPLRRMHMTDGITRPLQKSVNDAARLASMEETGRVGTRTHSADESLLQVSESHKLVSTSLSDRVLLANPAVRSQSLPTPGSHPPSPTKTCVSKGISPARTRPSTPPSRGVSPSRIRSSSVSSQANNSSSVLSFIADFKKGKKGTNFLEDGHQLRLLYNRYLQWRFANARAEAVLYFQKVTAEKTLYSVWSTTLALRDSVIRKRINVQQLTLELKLNAVVNDQMSYLDDWALLERDHIKSLSGAVEDLEASTLRLPVTGGAKADIECLKFALCSAVDVMQAMGSSICSLLSRVEQMNGLVSELAIVVAEVKAKLDEYEALLVSAAATQVEEYSFRTHLIQMKQAFEMQLIFATKMPPWP